MLRRLFQFSLALIFFPFAAVAQSACLPKALFQENPDGRLPVLDLARDGAEAKLCAWSTGEPPKSLGCWTINPANGAVSASASSSLPGHGVRALPDATGCIDGYCVPLAGSPPSPRLFAVSTSGAHVVVQDEEALHVFEAATKTKTAAIKLSEPSAPQDTNVTNVPVRLLFADDTIYVVGSDAGPWIAVWRFGREGQRMGVIKRPGTAEAFNAFEGAVNILDGQHVALADAGARAVLLVPVSGGAGKIIKRTVSHAPCTKSHMLQMAEGDLNLPSACRSAVRQRFEPYFDAPFVRLTSGAFLALLTGPAHGQISILNASTLAETARRPLARCP